MSEENTHGTESQLGTVTSANGIARSDEEGTCPGVLFLETPKTCRTTMADWVNVFEKAALDMKAEGLNVELKSMGWHLFEKSNLTMERQERVLGCAEGNCFLTR